MSSGGPNLTLRTAVPATPESGGFILVGVVMFMLALTILGLSLFSLSSYEGQFFHASVSREQSLHNSESGMELVKALLAARDARLEHSQFAVGQFGITGALAYQANSSNPGDTTSRGPVRWDRPLYLVVSGRAGGEERTVESRFDPQPGKNPYQTLVTCGLGFQYSNNPDGGTRTTELTGKVWQRIQWPSDSAWTNGVRWPSGRPIDPTTPPLPLADAFVDAKLAGAYDPGNLHLSSSGGSTNYFPLSLNTAPGTVRFATLSTPDNVMQNSHDPERNWYGCFFDAPLTISVRGTWVLVLPDGACFENEVTIQPDGNGATGTLVIVAKANGQDPGHESRGIWFQGGLIQSSSNIKVFLVSQGDISITHDQDEHNDHVSRALSVVCGGDFDLMGPGSGSLFRMLYGGSTQDAIADELLTGGTLPPITGSSGSSFQYASASWKETRLP